MLIVMVLACWEVVGRSYNPVFLPPPSLILQFFTSVVFLKELSAAAFATVARSTIGFGVAAAFALAVGLAMALSATTYRTLHYLVELLRPIPSSAVIPVAIVLFGIGDQMKILVVVFGALWPILLNTIHGVLSVDPILIDTARIFGFSRVASVKRIFLPAALPAIMTGMRISSAIALIIGVTVEMVVNGPGLGFLILDYERSFRYPEMYAGILVIGLIGLLIDACFVQLESRFLGWTHATASKRSGRRE